jgi:tRNA:m4X modification enzyme
MHSVGSGASERVPCPLDPNHTVLKRDVEKHLLRCNKVVEDRFASLQPFTNRDCNLAFVDTADMVVPSESGPQRGFADWREALTNARIHLVNRINASAKGSILMDERAQAASPWSTAVNECSKHVTEFTWESRDRIDKHNLQNGCILQLLNEFGMAPGRLDQRLFVELGCGKAGLTRWLIHSLPEEKSPVSAEEQPIFMLLDYEARRNKNENKKEIKSKIPQSNVIRLRSNIKDVNISEFLKRNNSEAPLPKGKPGSVEERLYELQVKIHEIQTRDSWPYQKVVGTAKHLCGAATDFGLRCLSRVKDRGVSLVFATCCHHRCDWNQLVSREILKESGACQDASEFREMISMAGWATTAGLSEEKRIVGRLVKSAIDLSRIVWLLDTFPNISKVDYRKYIEDSTTPENFCMVMQTI